MRKLYFDSAESFASVLSEEFDCEEYVAVYGYYDDVLTIAEELIKLGNSIVYMDVDYQTDYDGLYILFFDSDGVSIEKAKWDNRTEYKYDESDIAYILPGVLKNDSGVLNSIKSDNIYEIYFEEECADCSSCPDRFDCDEYDGKQIDSSPKVSLHEDEDGKFHGVTMSSTENGRYWSYSFDTTEELNKEDIEKVVKLFMNL